MHVIVIVLPNTVLISNLSCVYLAAGNAVIQTVHRNMS